jgi:hypothetical protein
MENKRKLYRCLDLYVDFVNIHDIFDISEFDFLFENVMVDELIYILPQFRDQPCVTRFYQDWLFKDQKRELDRLKDYLNEDGLKNLLYAEKNHRLLLAGEYEPLHISFLCRAYGKFGYAAVLSTILSKIKSIINIFDKIDYYMEIGSRDKVLELFPSVVDVDIPLGIIPKLAPDDLEFAQKIFALIPNQKLQQLFLREVLHHSRFNSKLFSWALTLFDPNFIGDDYGERFIIRKSYVDIRASIVIGLKIEEKISPEAKKVLEERLREREDIGLHGGYEPLLKKLFNL